MLSALKLRTKLIVGNGLVLLLLLAISTIVFVNVK